MNRIVFCDSLNANVVHLATNYREAAQHNATAVGKHIKAKVMSALTPGMLYGCES